MKIRAYHNIYMRNVTQNTDKSNNEHIFVFLLYIILITY